MNRTEWTTTCAPLIAGILLFAGSVSADECRVGCNLQKRDCITTARMVKLACKLDCRTNAAAVERGACARLCVETFRTENDRCRTQQTDCGTTCIPPSPDDPSPVDPGCLAACGTTLAACVTGVTTGAKDCARNCRSAPDRLACLEGCVATATTNGEDCKGTFAACVETCGVPVTTTTTVREPPTLP
jgi:hypothetical protein